jgi:hypothetical protein
LFAFVERASGGIQKPLFISRAVDNMNLVELSVPRTGNLRIDLGGVIAWLLPGIVGR